MVKVNVFSISLFFLPVFFVGADALASEPCTIDKCVLAIPDTNKRTPKPAIYTKINSDNKKVADGGTIVGPVTDDTLPPAVDSVMLLRLQIAEARLSIRKLSDSCAMLKQRNQKLSKQITDTVNRLVAASRFLEDVLNTNSAKRALFETPLFYKYSQSCIDSTKALVSSFYPNSAFFGWFNPFLDNYGAYHSEIATWIDSVIDLVKNNNSKYFAISKLFNNAVYMLEQTKYYKERKKSELNQVYGHVFWLDVRINKVFAALDKKNYIDDPLKLDQVSDDGLKHEIIKRLQAIRGEF